MNIIKYTLKYIFIFPFIFFLNIIVITKMFIRSKVKKDVSNENAYNLLIEYASPLIEKYEKHAIPTSAVFWLTLYLILR